MEQANEVIDYIKNKKMIEGVRANVMAKFPYLAPTVSELEIEPSKCPTACTNGKKVMYNPEFFESLSEDERTFTLAHEAMHIAFDHVKRAKDGEKDPELWNMATDAVINQMLDHAGLPIKDGFVNMPEALDKSADEMYEIVKNKKRGKDGDGKGGDGLPPPPQNHDDWEPPEEENENKDENSKSESEKGSQKSRKKPSNAGKEDEEIFGGGEKNPSDEEKNFNKNNDKVKEELGRQLIDDLHDDAVTKSGEGAGRIRVEFDKIPKKKKVVSWQKILKAELEKDELMWSYRRADADNYYQARIGELEQNNRPLTQVLLDTSGSISKTLLLNFLSQIKPLLKDSDIEVGCFDDEFYGFQKVRSQKDINNLKIIGRGGTDFNIAVKSFKTDPKINKIVFTDGWDSMTLNDKKYKNIIWVVFDNELFKPAVGRVINVSVDDINAQKLIDDESSMGR